MRSTNEINIDRLYIEDRKLSTPVAGVKPSNVPNSAMNEKGETVGTPVDLFAASDSSACQIKTGPSRSAKEINQSITVICQKHSIDLDKIKTVIERLTAAMVADKDSLTETQKAVLLEAVEGALKRTIESEDKNLNINILERVLFQALVASEAIIINKSFKDLRTFDVETKDCASDYIKGLKKVKSAEEYRQLEAELEVKLQKWFENKKAEIDKISDKAKREAALNDLISKDKAIRQRIVARYGFAQKSDEFKMESMSILHGKDRGRFQTALYKMQTSDEARKNLAKYFNYDLSQRMLMASQARGEEFPKESWQEYIQVNTSWQDAKSLNEFNNRVMAAATSKDNKYYTDDVIKATIKGIGIGAQINHVMTKDEINHFVEKWSTAVEKYYKNDPEALEELKTYVKRQVEELNKAEIKHQSEAKAEKSFSTNQTKQPVQVSRNYTSPIKYERKTYEIKTNKEYNNPLNMYKPQEKESLRNESIVREKILSNELKTNSEIKKALGVSSELEAIEFIAKDPQLKISEQKRIISYVRAQDIHNGNIETLAINVPSIMDLILPNIKSEYVPEFVNNVKMKIGYDQRKILEMKTQDKNKEAEGVVKKPVI